VKTYLDAEAAKLAKRLLDGYRIEIKGLSDERQDAYRQIKAMSTEPEDIDLAKPTSWMEATTARAADGNDTALPTYKHHLLCDEDGVFPAEMNAWETQVLHAEILRKGFQAWYRNPSRSSQDSLGVAYTEGTQVRMVRPDFIFFSKQADGSIAADIVDPHGTQFSDALPKLQGLVRYAETHPKVYRRIESVAEIGGKLRVLDLSNAEVRKVVSAATEAKSLYAGSVASDFN
jgi:type III restriction enzyme